MKKVISLVLSLVMLFSLATGMNISVCAKDYGDEVAANVLTTGDTFKMGMYPQSRVTDETVINAIKDMGALKQYGYKNKNGVVKMYYADIAYQGSMYRKVVIDEYRTIWGPTEESSAANSYQDDRGYELGTYYFKWEPIVWQVLAKEEDGVFVVSRDVLDSQAHSDKAAQEITWETSFLRQWLNETFYQSAFSMQEQKKLCETTLENTTIYSPYFNNGAETIDKVWLLSYYDVHNPAYGFNSNYSVADDAKYSAPTDYTLSQNISVKYWDTGAASWWLRTTGEDKTCMCYIPYDLRYEYNRVWQSVTGVRPACKIKLEEEISQENNIVCQTLGHQWNAGVATTPATCTATGITTYTCSACGTTKTETIAINKTAHQWNDGIVTTPATETAEGVRTYACTLCGAMKTEAIAKLPASTQTTPPATTVKKVKLSLKKSSGEKEREEISVASHAENRRQSGQREESNIQVQWQEIYGKDE